MNKLEEEEEEEKIDEQLKDTFCSLALLLLKFYEKSMKKACNEHETKASNCAASTESIERRARALLLLLLVVASHFCFLSSQTSTHLKLFSLSLLFFCCVLVVNVILLHQFALSLSHSLEELNFFSSFVAVVVVELHRIASIWNMKTDIVLVCVS